MLDAKIYGNEQSWRIIHNLEDGDRIAVGQDGHIAASKADELF